MNKALKNSNLPQRPAIRSLLAISLALSLAAFGCTTDRTLGNGDPVTTPGLRTSPTGGSSIGSESTSPSPTLPQSIPQSMTSSSSARFDALPAVTPKKRLTPDQAAAIMAQYQSAPRVRVLGPALPGAAGRGYVSDGIPTGQYINPALITNPQVTVNSTISSTPTPVVSSGAGGTGVDGGAGITGAVSVAGTTTGGSVVGTAANGGLGIGGNASTGTSITSASTVTGDDAAAIFSTTPVSPTASAAATLPAGSFAAGTGTLTPTAASAISPGVTAASNLATRTLATTTSNSGLVLGGNANTTSTSVTATTNRTSAVTTASATSAARSNTTSVRIVTDANGRRTVTNQ